MMKRLQKIKDKIRAGIIQPLLLVIAVLIIGVAAIVLAKNTRGDAQEPPDYGYDQIEQQIADEVIEYLSNYLDLPDDILARIADAAVENYNIIMTSDVDIVNDDHTDAIRQRIRSAMIELIAPETLSTDDMDGLSSGIAEIIWNAILNQIKEVVTTNNYEKEYFYLAESIQNQIEELEERKMKVSIKANIQNNTPEIDAESLLATIYGMTDEELQALAESLGISLEELRARALTGDKSNEDFDKELNEKLEKLRSELSDEIQKKYANIKNSNEGKNGRDGQNGSDGKDGQDGKDGENGSDGKTTFIAYADDMQGAGFSLTPTETSKYVGTCITSDSNQPKDYASYSNWQIYRTYIITTTTDENNVTTLHIN